MITPNEYRPELGKMLGYEGLYLKREDLHPYASHKGRSIPFMIDYYHERGERQFAISSSGNAAIAAALHIDHINADPDIQDPIKLKIFVGNNIATPKLNTLRQVCADNITLEQCERQLMALSDATKEGYISLRQSTDEIALTGYKQLAEELIAIPKLETVFIAASSGTAAEALARYFVDATDKISVNIVQTSSCHALADAFGTYVLPKEQSAADAIIDIIAYRKQALFDIIVKSGGNAWCATNDEIANVVAIAKSNDLDISANGALPLVALKQAIDHGRHFDGNVVCIISGQ